MKYTNESALGRSRCEAMMREAPKPETEPAATKAASKVDPSVVLGPLEGEPLGCVPLNSPAYTGKF